MSERETGTEAAGAPPPGERAPLEEERPPFEEERPPFEEERPPFEEEQPHRGGLPRPSRAPWFLLGLAVAAAALLALWLRQRSAPVAPVAEPAPAAAPGTAPGEEEAATPAPAAGPERVRSLLEAVSSNPLFRGGLAQADPLRRWAVVTDNLALGESPRRQLAFLAPRGPFSVAARGGKTAIAPESYRRYDGFAAAVASLDAPALARAYRELHAALEAAYRALGYPAGSLDQVTARALWRLEAAPVEPGEVEVVEGEGALYLFADARLEGLGAVEKHLLRMGPRNTRLIQAKAREIRQALGLPAPEGTRPRR